MSYYLRLLNHYTGYLSILLVSLLVNSNNIIGSEGDTAPLSRDQLEEKLEKHRELLDYYNSISRDYMVRAIQNTDPDNATDPIYLGHIFTRFESIINENIKNIEDQIDTYDEEDDFDTRNNNQNDDAANPNRRLHNQNPSTPLYLKIIIGIVVVSLISFIAILIWESLPKKKNKQTQKLLSPTLVNPKNA